MVVLTLDASLRDRQSARVESRLEAVQSLPLAYVATCLEGRARFRAAQAHPRGAEVMAALRQSVLEESDSRVRGQALVGMGKLGAPELLTLRPACGPLPSVDDDDDHRHQADRERSGEFETEMWVIGLAHLASLVPESATDLREAILSACMDAESSQSAAFRFAAAGVLAELGGHACEMALVERLNDEPEESVREATVRALSRFDPPGSLALEALANCLDSRAGSSLAFEAAVALAAARDRRGLAALSEGLDAFVTRATALEALAVFGPEIPESILERVRRLTRQGMWASPMRVRALYCWASAQPESPARAKVERLTRHWRPSVRSAAAEALQLLDARTRHDGPPAAPEAD